MKVYVDLLLFFNFAFDFILLLCVSLLLKRNISLKRLFLGGVIGSLTILVLFISFTSLELFLIKIVLSIIIILVTYGYKDIKYTLNNLLYFYIISLLLGGILYYLNIEFSYKNIGMIFYHKGLSINYAFILILSPLLLYYYVNQMKKIKVNNSLYYKVDLYIGNRIIKLNAFLDTANTLVEPYSMKKIIIVNSNIINKLFKNKNYFLVPIDTINDHCLLKCYRINKVYIESIGLRDDIVIGVTNKKIKKNGVNCLLNYLLIKEE